VVAPAAVGAVAAAATVAFSVVAAVVDFFESLFFAAGWAVASGVTVGSGSSAAGVDGVLDEEPVLVCALTVPAGAVVGCSVWPVVPADPVLGFGSVVGSEAAAAAVGVVPAVVPDAVVPDGSAEVPGVVEVPGDALVPAAELDDDEVVSSAAATPCPVKTAVPTPSATASLPTRPT
jgi:hypothetical protein